MPTRILSVFLPLLPTDRLKRRVADPWSRSGRPGEDGPPLVTVGKIKGSLRIVAADAAALGTTVGSALVPTGTAALIEADQSCTSLGGYLGAPKVSGAIAYPLGQCYTKYSPYDALIELEKRGQAYIDFEADLPGDAKLEAEAAEGFHDRARGLCLTPGQPLDLRQDAGIGDGRQDQRAGVGHMGPRDRGW